MSNETGKDIYKEYVVKFWTGCKNSEERRQLNNMYHYKWSGFEIISGDTLLSRRNLQSCDFIELVGGNVSFMQHAPKTQLINGHKVVAPRYDMPTLDDMCFWLICTKKDGYFQAKGGHLAFEEREALKINGWFDNKPDTIACVNAHRESK